MNEFEGQSSMVNLSCPLLLSVNGCELSESSEVEVEENGWGVLSIF